MNSVLKTFPTPLFCQFASLGEAQAIIEAWRMDYNHHRPQISLGHLTPNEFVAQCQAKQIAEEVVCSS